MAAPDDHETEDFATLLAEYEGPHTGKDKKRRKEPQVGDTVRGRVVSIGRDAAFLDLGAKSDGMIDLTELRDADGKVTVQVGDELEARVVETGGKAGCIVLRRSLGRGADKEAELTQAFSLQIPIEGQVTGVNKGGLEVQIAGVRAFCPVSQIDTRMVEDAAAFVGQRLTFRITKFEPGPRPNLVVSRRVLLEEEAQERAQATRATLAPGAVIKGRISALKEFGAFVDLGGLEGMIHLSELGFQRVAHPKELLELGQEVEVQVLRIEKTDDARRPERIALSLKSLARDPWLDAGGLLAVGATFRGKVVRVESFGAFVQLLPGVEGLLHVSALSDRPLKHAKDAIQPGEAVEVKISVLDLDKRRIGLEKSNPDEADASDYRPRGLGGDPDRLGTFGDLLAKAQEKKQKKR